MASKTTVLLHVIVVLGLPVRLRPIALAAATTALGVMPLLPDILWVALAVTIMCGRTLGTPLTMLVVPVMYAPLYRIKVPAQTG